MPTTLVNLLSEQRLPNFIATLHICPDEVVALTSGEFADDVDLLAELTGTPHRAVPFEPYDLPANLRTMRDVLAGFDGGHEVVINFTGGTKVMSLGAVLPCLAERNRHTQLCYVDTRDTRIDIMQLETDGRLTIHPEPIRIPIPFEAYVRLRGDSIRDSAGEPGERARERLALSRFLAGKRTARGLFRCQRGMFQEDGSAKARHSVTFSGSTHAGGSGKPGEVRWHRNGLEAKMPGGQVFSFPHPDGGRYFSGGWLEEFVFVTLTDSGHFDSVLGNVVLTLRPDTIRELAGRSRGKALTDKNEIDVVVIKGPRAAIVECKAGFVRQDQVYKLAFLRDYLLGAFGRAVIAARVPSYPDIREKCRDAGIELIAGDDVTDGHLADRIDAVLRS